MSPLSLIVHTCCEYHCK